MSVVTKFKSIQSYLQNSNRAQRPVLTIGNFDGVHLGHRALVQTLKAKAKQFATESIALTFNPHPQNALYPEKALALLLGYEEKLDRLLALGIDRVIEEPFSREFSIQKPEEFFENLLVKQLGACALVVGYDFGFGKGRSGGLDLLKSICTRFNIELNIVGAFESRGQVVSSSLIRKLLSEGRVDEAELFLGYPFTYRGVVTRGEQRGRRIGFPTANVRLDQKPDQKMVLPFGVYATRAHFWGKQVDSVTNIGIRPTFFGEQDHPPVLVETYVMNQEIDLYGVEVAIEFKKFLRSERKFAGAKELTDQIQLDVRQAIAVLQSSS